MTRITIRRYPDGTIEGFSAEGHSGFASKGEDIVCAGVSALAQTAILALEKVAGVTPVVYADEKQALIDCVLPDALPEEKFRASQVILATMALGLTEMANEYPDFLQVFSEGGAKP